MSSSSDFILGCESITRSLGGREILGGITLSLHRGAFAALLGPSGSGKTTLLQVLGLLDRPDTGRVLVDGTDVAKLSSSAHAHIRLSSLGYVFQTGNLLGNLSALENVALSARRLGTTKREAQRRARALLERFGLGARAGARACVLSPGEAQRVAIARALVNSPSVLLCDEPTGSLDAEAATEVLSVLSQAAQMGVALLVVTHDPRVALAASERWDIASLRTQVDTSTSGGAELPRRAGGHSG